VVYSDGIVSYSEAWYLSATERETFVKVLTDVANKKSGKNQQELI